MKTKAIVLKKQNTNEHDQLVSCYTEEFGKLTAVAKSANKPSSIQGMHLDLFNLVDFELINGRATPIITGAQADRVYPNLKSNLASLATAYFFAETADRLFFDYQKDDEVWFFFNELLEELEKQPSNSSNFLLKKQIEFLNVMGYYPNLNECAFCAISIGEAISAYSIEAKGAVCRDCFLGGRSGVVIKNGELFTSPILGSIFEGLVEKKLHSLNFIRAVIQSR